MSALEDNIEVNLQTSMRKFSKKHNVTDHKCRERYGPQIARPKNS
uniref:Uncharacterized protein n=1 Tax=Lepeophtheirus salmonis TaxID=72036 RepID=A0A0K2VKC9_LEPSM